MIFNKSWVVVLVVFLGLLAAEVSFADSLKRVEVPVGNIFVPATGFDDNDNVQLMIDGVLPNGCYQIDKEELSEGKKAKTYNVKLFAYKRTEGSCADESNLPNSLMPTVPYTLEVSLGQLASGAYKIAFSRPGLSKAQISFSVRPATSSLIDAMPYAAVSSVWIPDQVPGDKPVTFELVGSLTSSCSYLNGEPKVQLLGNVFIVLQSVGFKNDTNCTMGRIPFKKTVSLGTMPEGRYLIHVRSMNGRSVNRAFTAISRDPE